MVALAALRSLTRGIEVPPEGLISPESRCFRQERDGR